MGVKARAARATVTPAIFRLEGDFWTIAFGAELCRLRDSAGLRYLATLPAVTEDGILNGTLSAAPIFKSTDGGDTWNAASTRLPDLPDAAPGFSYGVHALAIDPATPSILYAGTDTGVFKSTDGGGTWDWRSDGTDAGTVLVKQLPEGLPLSSPLTNIDGLLLFGLGGEIWQSDGTEAGTGRIQDLGPLAAPTSAFTLAGGHVFFSADAGGTGPELWALPLATSCRGECSGDGRVTISDLITAVNIALGRGPLSACQSLDTNDGGSVDVDEIVAAVNEALHGCT